MRSKIKKGNRINILILNTLFAQSCSVTNKTIIIITRCNEKAVELEKIKSETFCFKTLVPLSSLLKVVL